MFWKSRQGVRFTARPVLRRAASEPRRCLPLESRKYLLRIALERLFRTQCCVIRFFWRMLLCWRRFCSRQDLLNRRQRKGLR